LWLSRKLSRNARDAQSALSRTAARAPSSAAASVEEREEGEEEEEEEGRRRRIFTLFLLLFFFVIALLSFNISSCYNSTFAPDSCPIIQVYKY
jgi:hypothetical protein